MAKNSAYVVWQGRKPGVYKTWAECEQQVKGYPGARYQGCKTEEEARVLFLGEESATENEYETNSVCVDAACSGNPGVLEFRCVDTLTGDILFHYGPFAEGTNNIGEFLGLVCALQMFGQSERTIYSDSQTALAWVKNKKINTVLERNAKTEELWRMVDEKTKWLESYAGNAKLLKWDTVRWGEIKADFGRK